MDKANQRDEHRLVQYVHLMSFGTSKTRECAFQHLWGFIMPSVTRNVIDCLLKFNVLMDQYIHTHIYMFRCSRMYVNYCVWPIQILGVSFVKFLGCKKVNYVVLWYIVYKGFHLYILVKAVLKSMMCLI